MQQITAGCPPPTLVLDVYCMCNLGNPTPTPQGISTTTGEVRSDSQQTAGYTGIYGNLKQALTLVPSGARSKQRALCVQILTIDAESSNKTHLTCVPSTVFGIFADEAYCPYPPWT